MARNLCPERERASIAVMATLIILFGTAVVAQIGAIVLGGLVALFDAFYRSGALVFGGGHVVLPLLREAFVAPGWL